MDKKRLLARVCESTGATRMMLGVRRHTRLPWLPVLAFHRVATIAPDYAFDEEVVDTTPEGFAEQIELLARYFTPIGLRDIVQFLDGQPLPKNPVLVTFDDGYRDNVEAALPVLRRHGVKAVFFVATEYLSERRVFWWDRITYLVKRCRRDRLEIAYPDDRAYFLATAADRRRATTALLRLVKGTYGLDIDRFLRELGDAAGVPWTRDHERSCADELLMSWDQVRELRAAGMEVQSHTRTHRVLQTLRPAELTAELAGSRADLERELDEPVFAISYPVGHTIDDRSDVRGALQRAGYSIGFTNATGAQPMWGKVDPFDLRRMAVDAETPTSLFRAMLAAPMVFS